MSKRKKKQPKYLAIPQSLIDPSKHQRIPATSYEGFLSWEVDTDSIPEPFAAQMREAFDCIRNNAVHASEMKKGAEIAVGLPPGETITNFFRFDSSGPDRSYGVNVQVAFAVTTGDQACFGINSEVTMVVVINTAKKKLSLLAPRLWQQN